MGTPVACSVPSSLEKEPSPLQAELLHCPSGYLATGWWDVEGLCGHGRMFKPGQIEAQGDRAGIFRLTEFAFQTPCTGNFSARS